MLPFQLRPYQTEALAAIDSALTRGVRRQLLAHPTGAGKTCTFVELIRRRGRRHGPALILAHRDELLDQAAEKLAWIAPTFSVGRMQAERDEHLADVTLAMVQSLHPQRLARLRQDFGTVIVDEAHRTVATSYQRILEHVGVWRPDGPLVLGVTATVDRTDGAGLDAAYDEIVHELTIPRLIDEGWLCDLVGQRIRLSIDWRTVTRKADGDFSDESLERAMMAANAPEYIVRAYLEHALDRKRVLVFTPRVAMAEAVRACFERYGFHAGMVSGDTPRSERRALLAAFHNGAMPIVVNCNVLTEGFDEPLVDCLILARPTRSRLLYAQMVGRGTRRGKENCLVMDLAGVTDRLSLAALSDLTGVGQEPGESYLDAKERVTIEAQTAHVAAAELKRLIASKIDLRRERAIRWVPAPEGNLYNLPLGPKGGQVYLAQQGTDDAWRVVWKAGPNADGQYPDPVLIAEGVPLETAFTRGEQQARQIGVWNPEEARRSLPPTPRQVEILTKGRHPLPVPATRGAASDLIGLRAARQCERYGFRRPPAYQRTA